MAVEEWVWLPAAEWDGPRAVAVVQAVEPVAVLAAAGQVAVGAVVAAQAAAPGQAVGAAARTGLGVEQLAAHLA